MALSNGSVMRTVTITIVSAFTGKKIGNSTSLYVKPPVKYLKQAAFNVVKMYIFI